MKEDPIYMGEWGWSWLGCCSLWFPYLSRSSLKPYKLPCNGYNFPPIGQVRFTFTPSFAEVCMKEDPIYMGEWGWSWLGYCSLWFPYLSRSSLKLYKLPCNGYNFPPTGQVRFTFTLSFGSMYEGRSYIRGRVGLVLVGLLQPLVPLFVQIFTKTI
jgi:hypothetical protein